jgi:hypothetical protein
LTRPPTDPCSAPAASVDTRRKAGRKPGPLVRERERTSQSVVLHANVLNREEIVSGLIYLIGLIVVILFILSFLGLR